MQIPLSKPDITGAERQAVLEVLGTSQLSLGPKLQEFENAVATYAGIKYAVAANSGTSALHLIVRALGIGKDDEVITTPLSFIASANCFVYEGARPVFVDVDPKTLALDPKKIEASITPQTKAILAVDLFGHPADWEAIGVIARKHNLLLIEDSAEALGSFYKGKMCGTFADAAVFSFYPNKQLTTGEGGVVVTNSKEIASLCQSMSNQGRTDRGGRIEHVRLEYNYRLSELAAALGLAQLARADEIFAKRAQAAARYTELLQNVPNIEVPCTAPHAKPNWFVYVVKLAKHYTIQHRDAVRESLRKRGIGTREYFPCIHLQPLYRELFSCREGMCPIAESASDRVIALPFFTTISDQEIGIVVDTLKQVMSEL